MANPIKLTDTHVKEFLKLCVEFGGAYSVNSKNLVADNSTGQLVTVVDAKQNKFGIMIYNEKMVQGDHLILNPFVNTLNLTPEAQWFYMSRSIVVGSMLKYMVTKAVSLAQSDNSVKKTVDQLGIIAPIAEIVEDRTLAECEKLESWDYGRILYNKSTMQGEFHVDVLDEDFRKDKGSKIHQKTWKVIDELMHQFLQTDNATTYNHKPQCVAIKQLEAFVTIMIRVGTAMQPYVQALLDVDLPVGDLLTHLEYLEIYQKIAGWQVSSSLKNAKSSDVAWSMGPGTIPASPSIPGGNVPVQSTIPIHAVPTAPAMIPSGRPVAAPIPGMFQHQAQPAMIPQGRPVYPSYGAPVYPQQMGMPAMIPAPMPLPGGFGGFGGFAPAPPPATCDASVNASFRGVK